MTVDTQSNLPSNSKPTEEDEISLLDLALVLAKQKKKIIALPLIAAAIAAAVAFSLPNEYSATLKIAPSKNAAVYSWVLTNDQVNQQVAKEMKLAEHFGTKGRQATRKEMAKAVKVTLNAKDGFLDVNVTDNNPEFAALLANKMGLALKDNLYGLRLMEISKLRYELETRREMALKTKVQFDAEVKKPELAATIATLSAADRYGITSLAAIQAESTLQGGVSDMMQNELFRMQDQLASLQRMVVDGMKKSSSVANTSLWIASIDALQQQAYWGALVERLDRRIELSKKQERDELKMTAAEVPDEKSGPKRALIVLLSAFAALFVVVLWAFIAEAIARSRESGGSLAMLDKIGAAWRAK